MDQTLLIQLHTASVLLFLGLFLVRCVLLLSYKHDALDRLIASTLWLEVLSGIAMLGTGSYLLFSAGHPETWLLIKVAVVIGLIPLSAVTVRNKNLILGTITIFGLGYLYAVSYFHSFTLEKPAYMYESKQDTENVIFGKEIYNRECKSCHGFIGENWAPGANKSLQMSTLPADSTILIIKHGINLMPSFETKLSDHEINEVTEYIFTLRPTKR